MNSKSAIPHERRIALIVRAPGDSARFESRARETVITDPLACFSAESLRWRCSSSEIDHSTRGVAIQRRCGSANDFDSSDRLETQIIDWRLAVRESKRHSVSQNADTPNAECGARTKSANRNARILRWICSTHRSHARDKRERFIE